MSNIECRPEALVIADALDMLVTGYCSPRDGAAELRRQHAEIEQLRRELSVASRFIESERALSASYVRIRQAIGAMDPPSTNAPVLYAYVEGVAQKLRAELDRWHSELTAVMRPDFKDWSSFTERPALAAWIITNQREHYAWAEGVIERLTAERDALRTELEALRAQEPVAWLKADWSGSGPRTLSFDGPNEMSSVRDDVTNPIWTPLYAAPQPPRELEALRAQEPAYYITVSGRLHESEPTAQAFGLPDGRHALYTAPQPPREVERLTDQEIKAGREKELPTLEHYWSVFDIGARWAEVNRAAAWGVNLKEQEHGPTA